MTNPGEVISRIREEWDDKPIVPPHERPEHIHNSAGIGQLSNSDVFDALIREWPFQVNRYQVEPLKLALEQ